MTKPTLESLNEAAQAAGLRNWAHAQSSESLPYPSIIAHALTLDKLHGRKEVSEAETFYQLILKTSGWVFDPGHQLDEDERKAIALIEAKFSELRAPEEPEWIEWNGGECPVAPEMRVELKFRVHGTHIMPYYADALRWNHENNGGDILAYRVL